VNFCDRPGRNIGNDNNASWLHPAFAVAYRLLKPDRFFAAWRAAGFYPVGHLVFRKRYASSTRFVRYQHQQACLLAKGEPPMPASPIPDVLELSYTGNKFHPTQKAVSSLLPIVSAFSPEEGIVLDPFCGSASSLLAAKRLNRHYVGIELDDRYFKVARDRILTEPANPRGPNSADALRSCGGGGSIRSRHHYPPTSGESRTAFESLTIESAVQSRGSLRESQ
jgi:site-specific DNA-methyltransferase (adenine-specific)